MDDHFNLLLFLINPCSDLSLLPLLFMYIVMYNKMYDMKTEQKN
jgi:hypothetical protein